MVPVNSIQVRRLNNIHELIVHIIIKEHYLLRIFALECAPTLDKCLHSTDMGLAVLYTG